MVWGGSFGRVREERCVVEDGREIEMRSYGRCLRERKIWRGYGCVSGRNGL
jgi:hypothetical protein